MNIKILFFAGLRETLGCTSLNLVLPDAVSTVAALRDHLVSGGEPWTALTTMKNLRVAVNQQMAALNSPVEDGDEVAFFPPVTGG